MRSTDSNVGLDDSLPTGLRREQLRLLRHFWFYLASLTIGLSTIIGVAYQTLTVVRVGGPAYTIIIDKKELIADILPPPAYVVESYLLVLQLVEEQEVESRIKLERRLMMLQDEYQRTQEHWRSKLPAGHLRAAFVDESYVAATEFHEVVNKEFLPAVHERDFVHAREIASGRLKRSFSAHRTAVDRTVALARAESEMAEQEVTNFINKRTLVLVLLSVTVGIVVVRLAYVFGRRMLLANQLLAHDLAERLRIEGNLRASELLRQEATKQDGAFKSALLMSIAHDLRSPLASIGASAELMMQASDPAERQGHLQVIEGSSRDMSRLVNNLFEMLKLEAGALEIRRELQFVDEIVMAAVERMRSVIGERRVQVEQGEGVPPVKLDETLMLVVFTNLLDNALKYSPDGSAITIDIGTNGKNVDIVVTNETSITHFESWEDLFLPFRRGAQTSKGRVRGTGLGLTICRGIIDAHGGHISLDSIDQGRVRSTVSLPMTDRS